MNNQQLQLLVEEISYSLFKKPFSHQASFNNRLRTTGGRYLLHTHDIEINPKYYEEHGLEEIKGIIKHELCHYHLHIEGKGYKHGDKDFKAVMTKVGAPRFCKTLSSSKRTSIKKEHVYECVQCRQRYCRSRRVNTSKYVCGRCKGRLEKVSK
ncbi:SprT family protein [Metabacillus iocasae]|uniref:Protein SprT-like n=1 Tax=Priestia iocasae TaxID=2291674 RepID=A0ABS2R049_9BACI|nr:SprT family protein [Metabacillus iocasae]MBM7705032.1 SprT-like protein [Metabacillus iocasae]